MPRTLTGRTLALAGCSLLVFLIVADRFALLRLDTVEAVTCVSELFGEHEDPLAVVRRHQNVIGTAADRAHLPPELVAAILADHQAELTPFRRFTDCAGSALGADLSLGPAQVRLSTAVSIDGSDYTSLSPRDFRQYRSRLLDPAENIGYQARVLRWLLQRNNRSAAMSADALIHDPEVMAVLITEYRVGPSRTPMDPNIRRTRAVATLRLMHGRDLYVFGRPGDDAGVRGQIDAYLTYINCESRNARAGDCQEWKNAHP